MQFVTKTFEELTIIELYTILQLRSMVFIIEQHCPYQDIDGLDLVVQHNLMLDEHNRIVGYTRNIPQGEKYQDAVAVGRVVTHPDIRRQGWGIPLMKYAIHQCQQSFPDIPIRISAQLYLKGFYENLGFVQQSDMYLEDDISHIEMLVVTS